MAESGGDYFCESADFDISQIIRIQAAVRGAIVRKWMKEVKEVFEETFIELEKNTALGIDWDSELLCNPKVVKTKDRWKNEKRKNLSGAQNRPSVGAESQNSGKSSFKDRKFDQIEHVEHNPKEFATKKDSGTSVQASRNMESETVSGISETVKDSPEFNSVEIQTSFIDVNFQNMPDNSKHDSDRVNDQDNNILEGLDTSWKDRVVPFIQNNFGETENEADLEKNTAVSNELHLDLDTDLESVKSQRSSKRSSRNTAGDEDSTTSEQGNRRTETFNDERNRKFETDERDTGRSYKTERSERSQSSSGRRYDQGRDQSYRDQRSSRSEDRSSRSHSKPSRRSPEYLEKADLSARRSNQTELDKRSERDLLSSRSHKSCERDQNLNETERFSPRGQKSSTSQNSDSRSQKSYRSEKRSEGQLSHRSDRSEERMSHRSDRSDERRQNSHRSEGSVSHRSDKSEDMNSQYSLRSQRSSKSEGQRSERTFPEEKMHPQQSRASPVAFKSADMDHLHEESTRQGRPPLHDSTSLTNVTSVWDSFNSVRESHDIEMPKPLPQDTTQLKELRKNIAMELLWVQQAIDSRKNYLKLKGKM